MKLTKHDRYVLELCKMLQPRYDFLYTHYALKNSKRSFGEVDVCAVKGDKLDLYEVKCSYRFHKAEKQLRRLSRLMNNNGKTFFFCGSFGKIQEIVV